MKPTAEVTPKKNYAPPQFSKYGTLTEMTAANGSGVHGDPKNPGKSKT
jgi:hypothetical protein